VDEATVLAARAGDRAARAALLRHLQDPLYRFCLSLLRDSERAQDAVQESAMRLLRDLPKFQGASSIKTWAMGIAVNVVREMRRSSRRDERTVHVEERSISPDSEAALLEQKGMLRRLLDELPERQREALMLRYFEELSVEEAAGAMNCAEGTVKATVFQALRALREKFGGAEPRIANEQKQ
jgi:RNA polymerase sigma-70 factor (ECF subfamily)